MDIKRNITRFWYSHNNVIARILSPFGLIYSRISEARIQLTKSESGGPLTICVGNFVVGGAGKTPLTIAVAERIARTQLRYCILTRGYLGQLEGPLWVDTEKHTSSDVGDEALVLARRFPTLVAKRRREGYLKAKETGFDIVIMDDGFQNPTVHKDISLIAMDAGAGVGNGQVFPAGPLRMRLKVQLPMTSAIVSIGDGFGGETVVQRARRHYQIPRFKAFYEAEKNLHRFSGRRVIAFCGIGRPEKFIETLEDAGVEVSERRFFPDHHSFTEKEAESLLTLARDRGLHLLTTEKDWVRIAAGEGSLKELKERAVPIKIKLTFDDSPEFNRFLKEKLSKSLQNRKSE